MTRKKNKTKLTAMKPVKKPRAGKTPRTKKPATSAEVRNDIAKMVKSGAKKITKAVMDQAMTGQLAPARYLFEVASIYPPATDGSEASTDDESLAETLMRRLDIPDKPIALDDDEDEAVKPAAEPGVAGENEKEPEGASAAGAVVSAENL